MHFATQHMPTAHPVFVVWKNVHRDDGSTERVGRAVIDSRALLALQPLGGTEVFRRSTMILR